MVDVIYLGHDSFQQLCFHDLLIQEIFPITNMYAEVFSIIRKCGLVERLLEANLNWILALLSNYHVNLGKFLLP